MTSSRLGASIVADLRSPLMARAVYVNVGIRPLWDFGGAIGHTSPVGMAAHCQDDDSREERLRGGGGDFSHHFRPSRRVIPHITGVPQSGRLRGKPLTRRAWGNRE